MRKLVALCFAAIVIPLVMGAGIGQTVTVNPGGTSNKIKGDGLVTLDADEINPTVKWEVTLKGSNPVQITSADAKVDTTVKPHTWEHNFIVAPATYNPCKATLTAYNMKTMQKVYTSNEDKTDRVVK